jgi:hypothetical protein
MTEEEKEVIAEVLTLMDKYDADVDYEGQVIIYTGIYQHDDDKYRTYPQDEN